MLDNPKNYIVVRFDYKTDSITDQTAFVGVSKAYTYKQQEEFLDGFEYQLNLRSPMVRVKRTYQDDATGFSEDDFVRLYEAPEMAWYEKTTGGFTILPINDAGDDAKMVTDLEQVPDVYRTDEITNILAQLNKNRRERESLTLRMDQILKLCGKAETPGDVVRYQFRTIDGSIRFIIDLSVIDGERATPDSIQKKISEIVDDMYLKKGVMLQVKDVSKDTSIQPEEVFTFHDITVPQFINTHV